MASMSAVMRGSLLTVVRMNEQDLSQVCAVLETVMRLLRERVIGVYHYGPGVLGERSRFTG